MYFPKQFERSVGGDGKQLGSDPLPAVGAMGFEFDNRFECRLHNTNGYPVQRIVVGYHGPIAAPALQCGLYVRDDASGIWFLSEPEPRFLFPDTLTYFDIPTLLDNPNVGSSSNGSIDLIVVVSGAKDAPAGQYLFVVGGDVSSPAG